MPSPATSLLNEKFTELSVKIKQLDNQLQEKLIGEIVGKSNHTNLFTYHKDMSIDYSSKLFNYAYWIGVINTNELKKQENPAHEFNTTKDKNDSWINQEFKTKPDDIPNSIYNQDQKNLLEKSNEVAKLHKINSKLIIDKNALEDKVQSLNKQIEEQLSKFKSRRIEVLQLKHSDTLTTELDQSKEIFHKQLPLILKLLSARNHANWPEFLWIYSAPGAGKTHLARQAAKMLNVTPYVYPCGPTITEGKLLGYNNVVNGQFVKGWLYDAYKNGGLVALDEIDLCDASVLGACNSIENETYCFGNGEFVNRHKDFYLMAFANTVGSGSTRGFQRNVIDAATLDRFTQLKLEYDEDMELALNGHDTWVKYVFKIRKYAEQHCAGSMYITPRASRKGAMYLKAGIDTETVCNMVLFSRCSDNIKQSIIAECGTFSQFHKSVTGATI